MLQGLHSAHKTAALKTLRPWRTGIPGPFHECRVPPVHHGLSQRDSSHSGSSLRIILLPSQPQNLFVPAISLSRRLPSVPNSQPLLGMSACPNLMAASLATAVLGLGEIWRTFHRLTKRFSTLKNAFYVSYNRWSWLHFFIPSVPIVLEPIFSCLASSTNEQLHSSERFRRRSHWTWNRTAI